MDWRNFAAHVVKGEHAPKVAEVKTNVEIEWVEVTGVDIGATKAALEAKLDSKEGNNPEEYRMGLAVAVAPSRPPRLLLRCILSPRLFRCSAPVCHEEMESKTSPRWV